MSGFTFKQEHVAPLQDLIQAAIEDGEGRLPRGTTFFLLHDGATAQASLLAYSHAAFKAEGYFRVPMQRALMLPVLFGSCGAATPLSLPDNATAERDIFQHEFGVSDFVAATVRVDGEFLGALMVGRPAEDEPFTQEEFVAVERVAQELEEALGEHIFSEKRHRTEERFRLLNELVSNPIAVLDRELKIREANSATADLFGMSAEDLLGCGIEAFFVAGTRQLQTLRDIERDGATFFEGEVKRHDGTVLYVDVHANLITISAQPMIKVFIRDITEQKTAEDDLKRTHEHIRHILESTNDAYVAIDADWSITYFNARAEALFQMQREEMLGRSLWDKLPEIAGSFYRKFHHSLEDGEALQFEGYYPPLDKWVETHTYPHPDGLSIFFRDITERRRASLLLQERELRLSTILDNMLDGVIAIDAQGLIQTFNPAAERLTGYTAEEIVGQNVKCLVSGLHGENHDHYLRCYLRSDHSDIIGQRRELEVCRKDGSVFSAEVSTSEMRLGNTRSFIATLRDVTEKKRAEAELQQHRHHLEDLVRERTAELIIVRDQAEQANRAKSAFLANMSHELRTPLNAIIGYSDLLYEDVVDEDMEEMRDDLDKIRAAGKHLLELISEVLDLSKIEAGKHKMNPERFSVPELVMDCLGTVQPLIEKNGNELQSHCADDVDEMVADGLRVRQSLINLLSNAAKFTQHGRVRLEVTRELRDGQPMIVFVVTDTGIGMSEEQRGRLFQSFSQGDTSISTQYGGTGLGLAISRSLCRLMGGDIIASSELGKGSRFEMSLPESCAAAEE